MTTYPEIDSSSTNKNTKGYMQKAVYRGYSKDKRQKKASRREERK